MEKKNFKRLIVISRLLFVAYLVSVLYFLLFAEGFGRTKVRTEYSYNLELFREIKRYIEWAKLTDTGLHHMMLNVWGNVLCFVPFGFLVPIIYRKLRKAVLVIPLTFLFSFMVELLQLIFKIGSFDVDDLVLNTSGGILGYIGFSIILFITKRMENK